MGLKFEWEEVKAKKNLKKHEVSFEEASTVFGDILSKTIPDPIHSFGERRYITIGQTSKRRTIVVIHTDINDNIRIISARLANKQERKAYEEAK